MPARQPKGLSVIEPLVAVAITLVFALVVIPQWRSGPRDERLVQAEFRLATLRGAIESYRQDHGGRVPPHDERASFWASLTLETRSTGAIDPLGECVAYLPEVLENPFNGSSQVAATTLDALQQSDVPLDADVGWLYNPATGQLFLATNPGFDL